MREHILKIHNKSMAEQHINLVTEYETWKGDEEQLDDICIFGVRV